MPERRVKALESLKYTPKSYYEYLFTLIHGKQARERFSLFRTFFCESIIRLEIITMATAQDSNKKWEKLIFFRSFDEHSKAFFSRQLGAQ